MLMSIISFYEAGLQETYVPVIPIPWPELTCGLTLVKEGWDMKVSVPAQETLLLKRNRKWIFFFGGIVFPCPGSNLGHSSDSIES